MKLYQLLSCVQIHDFQWEIPTTSVHSSTPVCVGCVIRIPICMFYIKKFNEAASVNLKILFTWLKTSTWQKPRLPPFWVKYLCFHFSVSVLGNIDTRAFVLLDQTDYWGNNCQPTISNYVFKIVPYCPIQDSSYIEMKTLLVIEKIAYVFCSRKLSSTMRNEDTQLNTKLSAHCCYLNFSVAQAQNGRTLEKKVIASYIESIWISMFVSWVKNPRIIKFLSSCMVTSDTTEKRCINFATYWLHLF